MPMPSVPTRISATSATHPGWVKTSAHKHRRASWTGENWGRLSRLLVALQIGLLILLLPAKPTFAREPAPQKPHLSEHRHKQWPGTAKEHAAYHSNIGFQLYTKGEYAAARLEFTRAIRLHAKLSGVFYNRGNANFRLRLYGDALDDYEQAVRLNPNFVMALANRGNALSALGRLDEALASYKDAARIEPLNPYVLFNRGFVFGKKHDYQAAIADFTKVLDLNPNDVDALVLRAAAYQSIGMKDKALKDFQKAKSLLIRHQPKP